MNETHSVSIDPGFNVDGSPCFLVTLEYGNCEVNVTVSEADLESLRGIASASWADRKSLRVGGCLGASVFWSSTDSDLSVLVGHDDETWEVGLTLPSPAAANLVAEIARLATPSH